MTGKTLRACVVGGLVACGFALVAFAAPPDPAKAEREINATRPHAAGAYQLLPDISVSSVWLGKGDVGHGFEPLGHNPLVGEQISLVCDVGISGTVPRMAFKMAWYVDGAKTCGEGTETVQNPPTCEFTWPLEVGQKLFVSYVPHQAGTHTYKCAADIGNQVKERNENNNSKTISFTVVGRPLAAPIPMSATQKPKSMSGPKLQDQ
jgi:hypothetical protein